MRKDFSLANIRHFLVLGLESSISRNIRESFVGFFNILSLGLKVAQIVPYVAAYDGTYGCFNSTCGFFIDTTCSLVTDKSYNWKRSHENRKRAKRQISSIIRIVFNDESSGKRSYNGRKKIQYQVVGQRFLQEN